MAVRPQNLPGPYTDVVEFWTGGDYLKVDNWVDIDGKTHTKEDLSAASQSALQNGDIKAAKQAAIDYAKKAQAAATTEASTMDQVAQDAAAKPLEKVTPGNPFASRSRIGAVTDPAGGPGAAGNKAILGTAARSGPINGGLGAATKDPAIGNGLRQSGVEPSAATPDTLRDLDERSTPEARAARRGQWLKWIGGGLTSALHFAFKDLLVDAVIKELLCNQFRAIMELMLVFFVIYVWGPNLINELDRFLQSLSTCSMIQTSGGRQSTYAFSCDWSSVSDDKQFETDATGGWCGAPDCYKLAGTCGAEKGASPSQWGVWRANTDPQGGGNCSSTKLDSNISCDNTVGPLEAPECQPAGNPYPAKAEEYRWQQIGLSSTLGALVKGGVNLIGGLGGWLSRNGWLLLAGILLLFVVIIPLITHFISSI